MGRGEGTTNRVLRSSRLLLQTLMCAALARGVMAAPPMILDPAGRPEAPATAQVEDPYLVKLETRAFVPRGRADAASFRDEKVFIEFQRTLTAEEQAALEAAGIAFHEALAPFTYLVSLPRQAAETLQGNPLFRGAEPIQPTDKVTVALFQGRIPDHARRPEGQVAVFFRFYEDATLEEALAALDRAGVTVADRSGFLFGSRLEAVATQEGILAASESPAVRAVFEIPPPPAVHNQQAAGISNVPLVNAAPYNLNGSSVAVGIWDEGQVRTSHTDLLGRVTIREAVQPISNHSTHVTGTILGTGAGNASAKGMASAATGFSFDFVNGDAPSEQANACRLPPVADGIAVANHSWGYNTGWTLFCPSGVCTMSNDPNCFLFDFGETNFGNYDGTTTTWDDLVRKKGLTVVRSAGNDGSTFSCGPADCAQPRNTGDCDGVLASDGFRYDTIEQVGSAKNLITVGALNDDGVTKTDFSSCGPANDGRFKPDVVANGRDVTSTGAASDFAYLTTSGTSMSGPVVSGVIALVDQAWKGLHPTRSSVLNKPSPELVKALLINTALDLGRPGPDYAYGHGLVKAKEAIDQMALPNVPGQLQFAPDHVRTAFISEGETVQFKVSTPAGTPTGLIKTTMAWSDVAGASASVVRYCNFVNFKVACTSNADCTPYHPLGACDAAPCGAVPCHLKNDLDGYLWNTTQTALIAYPFIPPGVGAITNNANVYRNGVDNVEVIQTSDANGGDLVFTVFGYTVTGGQQRFSLAANKRLIYVPGNDALANARVLPAMVAADPAATECPSGQSPCPATLYPHNTWDSVNFDATTEPGETSSSSAPQAHSVWFTWVAPSNGQATFDTAGADFDTTLEVWTGSTIPTLTSVAFSDDVYGRQSRVTFNAVAGTTYRVQVKGYNFAPPQQDVSMGVFPLNYYLIVCGNGTTEAGEQCDDGNSTNGDCCSSTCQVATGGSVCTVGGNQCQPGTCSGSTCVLGAPLVCNDSNVCTSDSCNPASGCVFANNSVGCDDGNACTTGDTCGGGTCHGGGPPAVPGSTPVVTSTSVVHLAWPALAGATGYDIVRGNLTTLRSSGGNFTTATDTCLANDQGPTGFDDPGTPAPGSGYFFLVRGTSCSGSGTYDTTSPKQAGTRDPEVNAAPITCSSACSRGRCTTGSPMAASCDSCVAAICAADPFCCNTGWDATCVQEVRTVCNSLTCPESAGACAHTVCFDGSSLVSGCDNPPVNPSCVAAICANDAFCCNTEWDGICVSEVPTYCGKNCN